MNITQLPEPDTGKLHLGRLVDMDYVYVNGKQVGHTGYQYPPRKYDNTLKIFNIKIKNLGVIRYVWADNPGNANLYIQEDLPAVPFEIELTKEK